MIDEIQYIQALEAYLYGANRIARSCHNKSYQILPTLQQLLAQMPPQFHSDPNDNSKQDPGESP
jgi:hypothetical protein